jgi:inositol-pentakisphosphate 2-kinase
MSEIRCCVSTSDVEYPKGLIPDNDTLIRFEYLNQGGANVIFKIVPPKSAGDGQPSFSFLDRKGDSVAVIHRENVTNLVLRVNKGLEKTLRCNEVVDGFYGHVRPLFVSGYVQDSGLRGRDLTKHLMEHQGVLLSSDVMTDLMSKCDTILPETTAEANKNSKSHRWGILLPDMSPTAGLSITIEIKPKWLAQSPNAPPNALRCRTCAMQVTKPKDATRYLCPLRLVDGGSDVLNRWILDRVTEQLLEHSATPAEQQRQAPRIASSIVTYLTQGGGKTLLEHLKALQKQLDPQGVLLRDEVQLKSKFDHNLRLAMTLRDCSMYITAHYTTSDTGTVVVDSKLGDLDFKSADKIDDWMSKEKELLEAGAYTRMVDPDMGCLLQTH